MGSAALILKVIAYKSNFIMDFNTSSSSVCLFTQQKQCPV